MDGLPKTTLFLLLLGSVFAKEIPASPKYFTKHTDSCPDVGYFFHREVLPNRTDNCHLCVCQQNDTASCWPRESERCDVNLPQGSIARVRRSPIGLSDIFFRDATRDFFHKQLPEQCKPHESSFSDGCPPADWCIGCTVCDCDAHGRWDCHILSFCNGEEKKRRVRRPKPVMPTRRVYHKGKPKPKPNSSTLRPKKVVKKSIPKSQINKKPGSVSRKNIKSQENGKSKPPQIINTTRRPQPKRLYKKNVMTRTATTKPKKRFIKKNMVKSTTNKPLENIETEVTNIMNAKSDYEKSELGKKIVKRVMSTVQKIIRKEISKLNDTKRVQRSIGCSKGKKEDKKRSHDNTKKEKKKKTKTRNRQINRSLTQRRKREALDIDLSMIDVKDDSDAGAVLPNKSLNVTFLPETTAKIMATTESPRELLNSTLDFVKYKYSLEKYSNNTTELNPEEIEITNANLLVNHTEIKSSVNTTDAVKTKDYTLIITDPNYNDLKHKKWERMKILRNSIKTSEVLKFDRNGNKSNFHDNKLKNKTRSKDIERKVPVTAKNNLKQIIRIQNKSTSTEKNDNYAVKYDVDNGNVSSFQSILHILINNSYATSPSKVKQEFNLFKYLRSMFKKIFNRKKNLNLKQNHRSRELQTLEILCENIGACFMNKHNRVALRSKLHDLNAETDKTFKFLKTIKGLLKLIEIPNKSIGNHNENSLLDDDIQKLNTILKGTYAENSLTETQTAQIIYLKENVHEFVRSISRFASILNDIFNVLYKNNKKYGCQRKLRPSQRKKKQNAFIKIKNLLVKYNIVQNTFMKNMYTLLTEMEKNKTTEKPKQKVSAIEMNNTQIIDTYSKSIIENLRRLKNLAQTLNSNRSKRQLARENHATEYLLMLMEYLLKQNQPSEPPVNDGIDLLVEAIENAPDVKFRTKKVFNYDSTYETTTNDKNMDFGSMDSEDSISDNKISKEELKLKNGSEFNIEQRDKEDESTQIVYYNKIDDYDNNTQTNNEYDTTEHLIKRTIHKAEKTGFDKFESAIDDTRRYEVFSSDLDDDEISFITSTNKNEPTTATVTEESNTYIALSHYRFDDDTTNSSNDTKQTLDWIEENFSREISDHIAENTSDSATPPLPAPVTEAPVTEAPVTESKTIPTIENLDNTSGMSAELDGEKMKKPSADEFLRKKQMQFLSYLDYGTESSDTESESKDKFAEDGFPSYFVR